MADQFSLDRWADEGRTAVLVRADGSTKFVPRVCVPRGARPGDVWSVRPGRGVLQVDEAATRALADETRRVQGDRGCRDPGGDVRIGGPAEPPMGQRAAVPPRPAWWAKGGSLDAASMSALMRATPPPGSTRSVFQSPVGSAEWVRQNPGHAADVLRAARGAVGRDAAVGELVGGGAGALPPSYVAVMDDPLGGSIARYAAAARIAAGDRSAGVARSFAEQDGLITDRENRARKSWAQDQEWKPGSSRRPEWTADLLKLHPEYAAALRAAWLPGPAVPPPPLYPRAIESQIVEALWRNITLPDANLRGAGTGGALRARNSRIDPNTAPAAVLGTLPGFGPGLSEAVIAAREEHRFLSALDFDRRVKGIGAKRMAELRPHLRFPGDMSGDAAGADRAYGDVLAGRSPRTIGSVGAVGGYTMRDFVNDILAKVKPRAWPHEDFVELPGISARETPMKPVDPAEVEYDRAVAAATARGSDPAELRKALGDYWKRVTAPAANMPRPRPSAAVGTGRPSVADWHSDAYGNMRDAMRGPTVADVLPNPVPSIPEPIAVPSGRRPGGGSWDQGGGNLGDGAVSGLDRLTRAVTAAADALEVRDRYRPPAALPSRPPTFAGRY